MEVLRDLLKQEKQKFEEMLKTPKEKITFETFEDEEKLWYFWNLLNHLQWVNRSDRIDKIIETFEPEYLDFANEISFSKPYFEMLVYCLENCKLTQEQERILKERIENFKLRWINLSKDKQDELKENNKQLSKLSQDFTNNITKDKANWEYLIKSFEDIKNLPKTTLEKAKKQAQEKRLEWYLFTADPTMQWDIMQYCDSEKIRKDFYLASNSFASSGKYDNRPLILEILKSKKKRAKILWYNNYAELSLERKMAETPEQVIDLIEWISKKALKKAKKEIEELKKYFDLKELNPWDLAYYTRLYKEEKYDIDTKKLKEFFEFDNVLIYLHNLVNKIYGIELKQIKEEIYSDDVKIYEVYKDNKLISYYFLDAFYRETKRPGAWADNLREKDYINHKLPIVVNVCNFAKNKTWENILSLSDVETIFHEFWHALHEMLSESKYSELSWFNVEWDFVELPSQLHENWVKDKESLKKLAKHYKTGEALDNSIIEKLEKLDTYMSWLWVSRQNEFALLDMYLYKEEAPIDIKQLDKKVLELINKNWIFKRGEEYKMYCAFNHIFGWGYAAWYYSYMWAEILEKDIWEEIKKHWIFNREIWEKFIKTILWQWTRKKASELFKDFMWREVDNKAFMKNKWLI